MPKTFLNFQNFTSHFLKNPKISLVFLIGPFLIGTDWVYTEKESSALFQSAIKNVALLKYTLLTFSLLYCFAGFPPIGYMLVDGTYIKMSPKAEDSRLYTCRKWFHALNVMMFTSKWYFYYKYELIIPNNLIQYGSLMTLYFYAATAWLA